MSKQSTRSKSKQGRSNSRPSNGTVAKANGASTAGSKIASAATSTTSHAAKTVATQPKANAPAVKAAAGSPPKQAQPEGKSTSKSAKQQRKQQRVQNRLAQQQQDARHKRNTIMLVAAAFVGAAGLLTYFFVSSSTGTSGHTVFNADYQPIDGVYCDQLEQTAYHHHVLLTIYINDQQVTVPAGVGLAGSPSSPTCYYWLHTHDTTGILHIEAPSGGSYSLKNFLDIWQNFAGTSSSITFPSQLVSSSGWTVYINGKKVNEDLSHVDISSNQAWHELITIMYNSPNSKPVTTYSWQQGL
jgi:hypothetical protein